MLKNANDAFEEVYPRILAREGGPYKITSDTGGVTKGGIAQSSGRTAAQIRALTPDGIKNIWHKDWDQSGAKFNNSGAGELFFDMHGNMNPAQATRYLQRNVNHLLPEGQRIPEDGVFGSGTVAATNSVPPTALSRKLYATFRKHHADVARERPTTHGQYLEGWNKRTAELAKSPLVAPMLIQPTLVKGVLHAPPEEPQRPVAQPTAQEPPVTPMVIPGGPLQSLPGLSAPPSTQYAKQASSINAKLRQACAATDKQKESGAYAKGEFDFNGIKIKIENPKGSIRSGSDKNGKAWSNKMLHSYGYFKGTKAIDGDAVDVFIGPDLDSDMVVVIDQECEGKYDESKFVIGIKSKEQGEAVYLSAYAKGWKLGPVSTTTMQQLKVWLKEGNTKKPFKGQMLKAASVESLFRAAMTARAISSAASPSAVGRRDFLSRLWRNVAPHAVPDRPVEQALVKAISAATSAKPLDAFGEATLARAKFNSPSIPMLRPAGALSDAFTDAGELAASKLVSTTPNAAAKLPRVSTLAVLPGTYDRRSFLKRLGVATAVDSGVAPTVGRLSAGLVNAAGAVGELVA
jgi:hypothetical protein